MMDVIIRFLFLFALVLFQDLNLHNGATSTAEITQCDAGTYLNQDLDSSVCVECQDGTFMPWKNHTAKECFNCTKIEDSSVEVLISKCDRFRDADIQCVDGHFRRLARNPREKPSCLKCTPACHDLFFEVHPCANFSDIGCCPGENYDYYTKSGVRMCRERPWMCRQGQYLDAHLNDCKPCPENTFMSEDYHSHTKCWECNYLSEANLPLHTVITESCTSTQPPQYRCQDGYYRNHRMSYRGDDIGCSPCQACNEGTYEVRPCNTSHNTLCCREPTMIERDGLCTDVDVRELDSINSQGCKNGTYNSPACDKSCSQYCRESERSDQSPCDQSNGTCLFGCLEGYTGSTCETLQGQSTEVSVGTIAATVVISVITLILIPVVILICVLYHRCGRAKKKPHTKTWEERQTLDVHDTKVTAEIKAEGQREGSTSDDGRIVSTPNIHTMTSSDRLLTLESDL